MKKVLSLVLVLAMVLGSFSFVSAAEFTDVTGTEFVSAVERLDLLGILEGYPDGTFKPAGEITRAEFAAVAIRARGLKEVALAAQGLTTGFTDVPATHWASGYIGTAARLSIVNGIGWGQFAPAAPVKYEEAVTMIVRALGYEPAAQAKGGYPYGYLIVASENGLLDNVKGVQGTNATRGLVAQLTDNALEVPKMIQVGFGTDAKFVISGSKEHGTDAVAQLLLHDLGVDEIKGYVTNNFRIKNTVKESQIEIDGTKYNVTKDLDTDAVLGAGVTAWAKDDVVFSVSIGFKYKRAGVDYEFTKDQIVNDRIVAEDTNDDEAYLYKLDDEYDWASRARIFVNNEEVDADAIPDKAYGRFILNENDEIQFAYLFDFAPADTGLVTKISDKDLNYVNLNANKDVLALDDAEAVYVFNKDLSAASLDDIKEDTAVFYWIDGDDNYYIVISNEIIEGTLEAVRVRDSRITVEGKGVKFEQGNALLSVDGQVEYKVLSNFANVEDYVDEEVVVYLNLVGDTLALVTDTDAASSTVYGIATYITSQRNPVLSVYTQEGKEVDYTFEETDDVPSGYSTRDFATTLTAVSFKVNKDGEIKDGSFDDEIVTAAFVKADDKKFGVYKGENLYITEDTVVLKAFNSTGKLKPSVIKYDNIINKEINTNNTAIVMLDKGNDLALLVFAEQAFQAVDDTEYGIITSDPTVRGTTYKAEIDVAGKGKETYVISKADDAKILRTGDLIEFRLNDKGEVLVDMEIDFRTDRDDNTAYEVVSLKDGNYITTNVDKYRSTTNTVIYAATKAGALGSASNVSRIAKGTVLLLIANSDDELKVALDITAYREGKTGTPGTPGITGVVTYINDTDDKAFTTLVLDAAPSASNEIKVMYNNKTNTDVIAKEDSVAVRLVNTDTKTIEQTITVTGADLLLPANFTTELGIVDLAGQLTAGTNYEVRAYLNGTQLDTVAKIYVKSDDASAEKATVKGVVATTADNLTFAAKLPAGTVLANLVANDVVITPEHAKAKVTTAPTTANNGVTWTAVITAEDGTLETITINVALFVNATITNTTASFAKTSIPAAGHDVAFTAGDSGAVKTVKVNGVVLGAGQVVKAASKITLENGYLEAIVVGMTADKVLNVTIEFVDGIVIEQVLTITN